MSFEILTSADGSPTIMDQATGATFHSRHGAISESRHIFIEHGLLYAMQRFGNSLSVFEVGFGSGLNAALTLVEAETRNLQVRYTAVEKHPLDSQTMQEYGRRLNYPLSAAYHRVWEAEWDTVAGLGNMTLEKRVADFCAFNSGRQFHAVYFDAFAPGVAPEMWTEERFAMLARSLAPGGALVTFCAQGEVRRRLRRAGYEVQKLPGAPGKREMTRAIRLSE